MPEQSRGAGDNTNGNERYRQDLQKLCAEQYALVAAFLEEDASSPLLHNVQQQTRRTLEVAKEALTRYRYVVLLAISPFIHCMYLRWTMSVMELN